MHRYGERRSRHVQIMLYKHIIKLYKCIVLELIVRKKVFWNRAMEYKWYLGL